MTTAAIDSSNEARLDAPEQPQPALPLRGDTLLGVCEAIGEDFGFNPNWLRLAFAALLLWHAEIIVAAYLALGIVIAVTRWMFPDRQKAASAKESATPVEGQAAVEEREKELLAA